MTYYERVMTAIKTRKPLKRPLLSLGLILKTGGIEANGYLGMCADRIAADDLIDGEDVRIDFIRFPDLLLSADGVRECRKILENYVSKDIIADAFEALCHEESVRVEISILAARLRELGAVNLIKLYAECGDRQMRQLVVAEAYHRSILSGALRKLRSLFSTMSVRIRYHRIFSIVDNAVRDLQS